MEILIVLVISIIAGLIVKLAFDFFAPRHAPLAGLLTFLIVLLVQLT